MRRLLVMAVLVILAAAPASATSLSVFAAGWNPSAVKQALGGGLGVTIPFGESPVGLDLRTTYYRDADVDNIGPNNGDAFGKLQIVPVDVAVRWDIPSEGPTSVYLGGGGSYMFLSLRHSDFNIDDEVGWLGFVGLRYRNFFVEGDYRNARATVKNDDISNGFIHRAKIDLDGPAINAGYSWTF